MKTIKLLAVLFISTLVFTACSDEDPEEGHEEEVITTMTITLTPGNDGEVITLMTQDLDGDGPDAPVVTVSGNLATGTTYTGAITLLNELEDPAEDITEEIEEEAEEHQFLFLPGSGLDMTVNYLDEDANGNPIGILFNATGNTAGSGNFRIVLKHEPTKPNDGSFAGAGGETDIDVTFPVTIE